MPGPSATPAVNPRQPSAPSPWVWVPSLYFSQGIPYVMAMTMSVVMYKRLGLSNTDIALYTSWLYLPWVVKPLWSPLVDITRTKRFWVVAMQFLVSAGLACTAWSVRGPGFFRWSLGLFWVMAFASATHDIAADGFYMLSLSKHEQAWWVGLRSTFYRTAMIVGSGLLVVLAGVLESKNGLPPLEITVRARAEGSGGIPAGGTALGPGSGISRVGRNEPGTSGGTPGSTAGETPAATPGGEMQVLAQPAALEIPLVERGADAAKALIDQTRQWNLEHGFLQEIVVGRAQPSGSPELENGVARFWNGLFRPLARAWRAAVAQPLTSFLTNHFPKPARAQATTAGNVGVVSLQLSQPPAAGRSVVVTVDRKKRGLEYLGLAKGDNGFRLIEGERFAFNRTNWNQSARVAIQLDPKLKSAAAMTCVASSGNIPAAWSLTLFVVAGLFLGFSLWHSVMLPRPANDGPVVTNRSLAREFLATLGSFFRKPGVGLALAFVLLYRFDEAQLTKVLSPFLLDRREAGGLGLTTSQVGLAYGTFGIAALTAGGLLGGFLAARHGLKRMLPFMVCSMYLPKLAFIFLSFLQPENFLVTCGAVALEQLGYGFGFTAFMLYLLYFADGPHKTAHYAIGTGFMALGMMIPGLWSGWLADLIGYQHFFIWVLCSALPGFTLALLVKVDAEFGKKPRPRPGSTRSAL